MSKKTKFYAVKKGRESGVYNSWEECHKQINGFAGAVFKSFETEQEATNFLNETTIESNEKSNTTSTEEINAAIELELDQLDSTSSIAFVDGTFTDKNAERPIGGFGVVIFSENRKLIPYYKSFVDPALLKLRNISGEILGAIDAIEWAIDNQKKNIKIYYDYAGIEKWANGEWKANNFFTKQYVDFIKSISQKITIEFQKIKAHSGIKYNELADEYASKITGENQSYSTHRDGNILYRGDLYNSIEKWTDLISNLNDNILTNEKITFQISEDKNRDYVCYLNLIKGNDKVKISVYTNSAYIQGKKSDLFYIINAEATSLLDKTSDFIENLSMISSSTINEEQVNQQFDILLPNFIDNGDTKLLSSLKGAVYNTLVDGYMPEYTGLLFYSIKLTDYYLHRILGDKLSLNTRTSNGANNFNYFDYDNSKSCWVTKSNVDISPLNQKQLNLLLQIVHFYKIIRHPNVHWSKDSTDTQSFTNLNDAKDYVLDSLTLFNEYYIIF